MPTHSSVVLQHNNMSRIDSHSGSEVRHGIPVTGYVPNSVNHYANTASDDKLPSHLVTPCTPHDTYNNCSRSPQSRGYYGQHHYMQEEVDRPGQQIDHGRTDTARQHNIYAHRGDTGPKNVFTSDDLPQHNYHKTHDFDSARVAPPYMPQMHNDRHDHDHIDFHPTHSLAYGARNGPPSQGHNNDARVQVSRNDHGHEYKNSAYYRSDRYECPRDVPVSYYRQNQGSPQHRHQQQNSFYNAVPRNDISPPRLQQQAQHSQPRFHLSPRHRGVPVLMAKMKKYSSERPPPPPSGPPGGSLTCPSSTDEMQSHQQRPNNQIHTDSTVDVGAGIQQQKYNSQSNTVSIRSEEQNCQNKKDIMIVVDHPQSSTYSPSSVSSTSNSSTQSDKVKSVSNSEIENNNCKDSMSETEKKDRENVTSQYKHQPDEDAKKSKQDNIVITREIDNDGSKEGVQEKEMLNDAMLLAEVAAMARTELKGAQHELDSDITSTRTGIEGKTSMIGKNQDTSVALASKSNHMQTNGDDRRIDNKTPPSSALDDRSNARTPVTPNSTSATVVTSNSISRSNSSLSSHHHQQFCNHDHTGSSASTQHSPTPNQRHIRTSSKSGIDCDSGTSIREVLPQKDGRYHHPSDSKINFNDNNDLRTSGPPPKHALIDCVSSRDQSERSANINLLRCHENKSPRCHPSLNHPLSRNPPFVQNLYRYRGHLFQESRHQHQLSPISPGYHRDFGSHETQEQDFPMKKCLTAPRSEFFQNGKTGNRWKQERSYARNCSLPIGHNDVPSSSHHPQGATSSDPMYRHVEHEPQSPRESYSTQNSNCNGKVSPSPPPQLQHDSYDHQQHLSQKHCSPSHYIHKNIQGQQHHYNPQGSPPNRCFQGDTGHIQFANDKKNGNESKSSHGVSNNGKRGSRDEVEGASFVHESNCHEESNKLSRKPYVNSTSGEKNSLPMLPPFHHYSQKVCSSSGGPPHSNGHYPGPTPHRMNYNSSLQYHQSPEMGGAVHPTSSSHPHSHNGHQNSKGHKHQLSMRQVQHRTICEGNLRIKRQFETPVTPGANNTLHGTKSEVSHENPGNSLFSTVEVSRYSNRSLSDKFNPSAYGSCYKGGGYHAGYPSQGSHSTTMKKTILRRKCAWKNYPELEAFLIENREEYLRHSAMNYTIQQKQYNNRLTERLLEVAAKHNYYFDENDFNFVAVRDRIRCYYKSYVQSSKKRGIIVGYGTQQQVQVQSKKRKLKSSSGDKKAAAKDSSENMVSKVTALTADDEVEKNVQENHGEKECETKD